MPGCSDTRTVWIETRQVFRDLADVMKMEGTRKRSSNMRTIPSNLSRRMENLHIGSFPCFTLEESENFSRSRKEVCLVNIVETPCDQT